MPKRANKDQAESKRATNTDDIPRTEDSQPVQEPSYTPPSKPNDAADTSVPHEDTRPETRAERRARRHTGDE